MKHCPTKPRILETAINLFSMKGYSGVSMRDIAREVGISPPALYNHFENKEALYRAAVSTTFEDKSARLFAAMSASQEPLQCLQGFIEAITTEMQEDRSFHRLMQRELLDADEERLAFLGGFIFNKVQQPFIQLLEKLKPGCDADLLAEMIFGMAKQHFEMRPVRPYTSMNTVGERSAADVAGMMLSVLTPFFQEVDK
jgi:AcrR family transcriptional regulator